MGVSITVVIPGEDVTLDGSYSLYVSGGTDFKVGFGFERIVAILETSCRPGFKTGSVVQSCAFVLGSEPSVCGKGTM